MNDLNQTLVQPSIYEKINLQPWRKMSQLPVIVQNERAECALACLAMVSGYFGQRYDLATLRHELGHVSNGMDLKQLIKAAGRIGLSSRPVKAQLHSLQHLQKPCILHWDMNHFVVLKKAGRKTIQIHDPAVGLVEMSYQKASQLFTGIAIELQPNQAFQTKNKSVIPSFRSLMGKTDGLAKGLFHILILSLLLQLIGLVSPAIMQWLIDNGLSSGDQSVIVTLVAGMAMLMIFNLTLGVLRSWMVMYLSIHVGFQWSSRILRHLFHLPVDFFERRHLGDIISRFGSVATIQQTVTTGVISAILDGLFGALILVMIWLYSPTLAMTAITAVLLLTLLQVTTFAKQKRLANEALMTEAKVSSSLMETIRGIRSVKLAERSDLRKSLWQNLTIDSINAGVRGQWLGIAVGTAGSLISGSQRIIAIFLAATMINEGQFTVGMLFAYLAYQDQFMGRANSLVGIYFQFKMLRLHFERLADIVLTQPETLDCIKEPSSDDDSGTSTNLTTVGTTADSSNVFSGDASVEFRDVSFAYSENTPSVLNHISFSSAGSKCTVITGRSGIGKTTIFKMLMSIYKPTTGEIFINGTPLKNIPVDTLRTNVSCVLQDDSLFAGSISENIAFFDMDIDLQRVEECAKIACIHDDIERTVMKYHTMVGDMGSMLSAGQKQRLLIARALYRKPKILLLDEATSDLDVTTEEQLNKNLAKLDVHRIYIAHRPQTIKYGDNVVKLDVTH